MKKHVSCFILALVVIVGLCVPVSAYSAETEGLTLTPVEDMEDVTIEGEGVALATQEDVDLAAESGEVATYEVRNFVRVVENHIYPIVLCGETGEAFVLEDIQRVVMRYDSASQSESIRLTTDQVNGLVAETLNALANNAGTSQYTWYIAGWRVKNVIELSAQNPIKLEWTPTETCLDGTALQTMNVGYQSATATIAHNYGLPEDPYGYYHIGLNGNFYFRYASGPNAGKVAGIMVGAGASMNV